MLSVTITESCRRGWRRKKWFAQRGKEKEKERNGELQIAGYMYKRQLKSGD
jgi:hypothetical protein